MNGEANAVYYVTAVKTSNSSFEDKDDYSLRDIEKLSPAELDKRRHFNTKERQALFIISGGKCQICNQYLTNDWEPDHIVPYCQGGATDVTNGQALCRTCNRKKGDS